MYIRTISVKAENDSHCKRHRKIANSQHTHFQYTNKEDYRAFAKTCESF